MQHRAANKNRMAGTRTRQANHWQNSDKTPIDASKKTVLTAITGRLHKLLLRTQKCFILQLGSNQPQLACTGLIAKTVTTQVKGF